MNKVVAFLKKNKEEALVGAAVGFVFAKFFIPNGFDFGFFQTQGITDVLISAKEGTIEFARTKAVIFFTITFGLLGLFFGEAIKEFFRKVKK